MPEAVLPAPAPARWPSRRHRALRPLALLLLGVLLSAVAAWQQSLSNGRVHQEALRQAAELMAVELNAVMERFERGLRGARGAVLAVGLERLDRSAFQRYVAARDLSQEFPGARGFGFIRRVNAADSASYTAAAAADGWRSFQIRQLQPHERERFVIETIEPVAGNTQAVGLDIASEPRRLQAALAAAHANRATLTRPITLVQATGAAQQSFLLLLPVYRPGDSLQTEEQRWSATVGWVYAPLITQDMLRQLQRPPGLRLSLHDLGAAGAGVRPADAEPAMHFYGLAQTAAEELNHSLQRPVLGRQWQLDLHAGPAFFQSLRLTPPPVVFMLGLLLTLLATALLAASDLVRRNRRLAQLEQARLAALVAQSSDAIVTEDLQGRITGWNRSAEHLFGHALQQTLGRRVAELLLPPSDHAQAEAERDAAASGHPTPVRDIVALHRDGRVRELSQSLTPIRGADGRVVGLGRTLRDVHERARAERERSAFTAMLERQVNDRTQQLDAARMRLQTVFDAVPSLMAYWDSDLVLRIANLAYHRWFGVPAGSLPGTPVHEVLDGEMLQVFLPRMRAALAGQEQRFDISGEPPSGGPARHVQGLYLPDRRADGSVQGLFVLVHDVTEINESRRRLADALRENEALVHTLRAHALYSVTDAQGRIIEVNDGFCRAVGYSREELMGQNHRLVTSGQHGADFWAAMWRSLSLGQAWQGQVCNRHRNGQLVWMDTMIAPFTGAQGQVERYVAIRHDVTDSRAAAQALARERERLHNTLRGTDLGTWEWNVQTGEAQFNERWAAFTGHSLAELQPASIETWRSLVHPEDLQRSREALARHYSGELPYYECEARLRHRDGHWVWVLGRGRLFTRTPDGQPEWLYGTHQDVSARRATEEALRLASHEAEAASKAKSAFLANMSHEVRTPLNAMMGLTALLADSRLQADQRTLLSQVQRASQSLLTVVNDVLDLAKIEAGEMRLEQLPFALADRLHGVAALHGAQARAKGLQFTLALAPELPAWVLGDPTRLEQLLHNLLANAVKFTAQGQVLLQVHLDETPAPHLAPEPLAREDQADHRPGGEPDPDTSPLWLRIEVQDTGIGIAEADQQAVFEPFAQADVSTTRRFGGTGLGLSIVRQVCSLMGGELGLRSQPGQGSCFWLRLPLGRLAQQPPVDVAAPGLAAAQTQADLGFSLQGMRVLVVDDSDLNRDVAQRLLQREGALTQTCEDAAAALAALQAAAWPFDAVLMDVQMPGMDGLEATRRLRALPGLAELPVVALTAGALPQQREEALAAGMDAFLVKPLEPASLVQTLLQVVQRARRQALANAGATAPVDAVQWPEFPGVDSRGAAQRLGGDLALFARSLGRLLAEFDDLAAVPAAATSISASTASEPQAQLALAARAHKLRGSAGLLGATTLEAAAAQLESRLRLPWAAPAETATDSHEAAQLLQQDRQAVATALQQLRQASAAWLARPLGPGPGQAPGAEPANATDAAAAADAAIPTGPAFAVLLRRLRQQLLDNDLHARHTLDSLEPTLQAQWGVDALTLLAAAIDGLDYPQALLLLQTHGA